MEQELIRVDRRYRLACSKKKSISACSAIMYQKLEQYAKLVCRIFCSILQKILSPLPENNRDR